MTAYTTNIAIPYPQLTDFVKDGATAMEAIAERVDDSFTGGRGFRNHIINPDFSFNQRGLTSTTTNNAYGHDRWRLQYNGAGTSTYTNVAFSLGNAIAGYEPTQFASISTSGQSGTSAYTLLAQRIESVRTLAGQQATISFYAKATSGTPKFGVSVSQYFGSGGSPSAGVDTAVGAVTLSTDWQRFQLTVNVPSISGKTIGTAGNDYLEVRFWASAGTDYGTESGNIGLQTATLYLWGVQVERGAFATPLEIRPVGIERLLCMRYYQGYPYGGIAEQTGLLGYSPSAYYYGASDLQVPMRATPSTANTSTNYWRRPTDASLQVATIVYFNATSTGTYWAFVCTSGGYHALAIFTATGFASAEL